MQVLAKLSLVAQRYFVLWVILAGALGSLLPGAFSWVGPQIPLLLGVIMFGMGLTLHAKDFRALLSRPKEIVFGVAAQYTAMPLLALLLSVALALPAEVALGVILLGACPGGTASNVVTLIARGDVALSVAITSCSTLLAPFLTPLFTLWLAGTEVDVSALALFLSILQIVILPVTLGVVVHGLLGERIALASQSVPLISVLAIMAILAFVIGSNAELLMTVSLVLVGAMGLHNLMGLAIGYGTARALGLPLGKRKAYCFEVGMQNSSLAVALATLHFGPAAALPGALFSVWAGITGPLLATFWARRLR